MLFVVIRCYLLLYIVVRCYLLLSVVICCLLLSVVICCYLDNDKYRSFPGRPGRCRHRSKASSYPGRRRTSKTVALQRHEFESRCDSTLPNPSPVLGMATAVWNLSAPAPGDGLVTWCTREVARGVYEMTAKLCQLLSAGDVAQEARLIGIDRWMIRRSYCVCGPRLGRCDRVSVVG